MALQMDYTTKSGITLSKAYLKIISVSELIKERCVIDLGVYKDAASSANNAQPAEYVQPVPYNGLPFSFVPKVNTTAKNYRQQAYEYLKTLDQFATATDV